MHSLQNLPAIGAALLVIGLTTGCGPSAAPTQGSTRTTTGGAPASTSDDDDAAPQASTTNDDRCTLQAGPTRREQVCHRWACDRGTLEAAPWTGDAARCSAGTADEAAQTETMRAINTYRFLANLPAIDLEHAWDGAAQDCALLAHANSKLSHE